LGGCTRCPKKLQAIKEEVVFTGGKQAGKSGKKKPVKGVGVGLKWVGGPQDCLPNPRGQNRKRVANVPVGWWDSQKTLDLVKGGGGWGVDSAKGTTLLFKQGNRKKTTRKKKVSKGLGKNRVFPAQSPTALRVEVKVKVPTRKGQSNSLNNKTGGKGGGLGGGGKKKKKE